MFKKLPKHSGIYHIKDNIDELQIEINFRHVHSLLKLPSYEINAKGFKFDGNEKNNNDLDGEHSSSTVRIKWQQKIMSTREMELYKNLKNCLTKTQKKYNKWLTAADANEKLKKRSKKSTRPKSKNVTNPGINDINEIFTYVQDDDFLPEEEKEEEEKKKLNSDNNSMECVSMYIYAAISPDTQLVSLKWFAKNRLLQIYPDFNAIHIDPYFIGIDTNYRHLFAYAVTNVSASRLEPNREHNIIIKPQWQMEHPLSGQCQFEMPPKRMTRLVLLFEIRSACGFRMHEPMHIRYHLHLPGLCSLEEGLAEASTHATFATSTTYMCSMAQGTFYHYGYNFQLTLLCDNSLNPSALLHIYFELISIDNWERERLEGYAHYSTYLTTAGSETQELMCLRPAENLLEKLTRYFIGGRRKFDYVQFFTPPKSVETLLHNRLGCHMINCGHLHIMCQKISQRNADIFQMNTKNLCSGMTIDDILLAYTQARKRLESFIKN